jgi:2-(1,2-epoxy-1,2-dihydrophenyl)acetyl-CoA isomerase
MVETDLILTDRREGYRVITLNRPDRLNSFNEAMHAALMAALLDAEADGDCRALILTGAGRGFCAGQDLSDRVFSPGQAPDLSSTLERLYNPLVRKLRELQMPVICAVNGVAAGAGANIALACDIVLAARSAKFIQGSSRHSRSSASCPIQAAPGSCRALSAPPAHGLSPCSPNRCRPNRRKPGA